MVAGMLSNAKFTEHQNNTVKKTSGARLHDCVYDLVYTVSSKDHERDLFRLQRDILSNKSFPTYETMFSDNPRYSRILVQRQNCNNGSKLLELSQGPIRSIRVAQVNSVPPTNEATASISSKDLVGRYRSRYFASPIRNSSCSCTSPVAPAVSCNSDFRTEVTPPTPPVRSLGTQTDYRDSEAQTDPYSPSYFVQPGTNPEILLLKDLKWGKGLPAGRLEVEMIQRARERRAGKAKLDKCATNDPKKLKKVLQSADVPIESIFYEEQRLQCFRDKRLELLAKSLRDLREMHGDLIQERLHSLWKRRHHEKDEKLTKMQAAKNREIRKLQSKRNVATAEITNDHLPVITSKGYQNNNNNNNNNNYDEFIGEGKCPYVNSSKDNSTKLKAARLMNHTTNYARYSDLSGLDIILPRVILSSKQNGRTFLNSPIPHSITRSGRRSKLERDLEEAYLKILEKKKANNGTFLPTNTVTSPKKFIEDAQTQTEKFEQPNSTSDNEKHSSSNEVKFEEELNKVLEQLLREHWEAIDEYFRPLLLEPSYQIEHKEAEETLE